LVEVVGKHHAPNEHLLYNPMVSVVCAGDFMARKATIGFSGDPGDIKLHPGAVKGMETDMPTLQIAARKLMANREAVQLYWEQLINPPSQ